MLRRVPCTIYTRTVLVIHFNYSSVALLLLLLSHFSRARLCATAAHQAPLSTEFSRQEYWSELPFPSPSSVALAFLNSHLSMDLMATSANKKACIEIYKILYTIREDHFAKVKLAWLFQSPGAPSRGQQHESSEPSQHCETPKGH